MSNPISTSTVAKPGFVKSAGRGVMNRAHEGEQILLTLARVVVSPLTVPVGVVVYFGKCTLKRLGTLKSSITTRSLSKKQSKFATAIGNSTKKFEQHVDAAGLSDGGAASCKTFFVAATDALATEVTARFSQKPAPTRKEQNAFAEKLVTISLSGKRLVQIAQSFEAVGQTVEEFLEKRRVPDDQIQKQLNEALPLAMEEVSRKLAVTQSDHVITAEETGEILSLIRSKREEILKQLDRDFPAPKVTKPGFMMPDPSVPKKP